ncbi:MAG: preprotein translocase subunit YajC [Lachnospiraceae bacterium]|nr:preprotein translocase subunit YajC [Lachnospiraceae bacterium]
MLTWLGSLPDWIKFILILGVFFVAYVIYSTIHYNQIKKQILNMQNELAPGDFILTQSGLYGTLISVGEKTARLKIAEHMEIVIDRFSIKERVVDDEVKEEAAAV